jgi:hypothetical protein
MDDAKREQIDAIHVATASLVNALCGELLAKNTFTQQELTDKIREYTIKAVLEGVDKEMAPLTILGGLDLLMRTLVDSFTILRQEYENNHR